VVPDERRSAQIEEVLGRLPIEARRLFTVCEFDDAAQFPGSGGPFMSARAKVALFEDATRAWGLIEVAEVDKALEDALASSDQTPDQAVCVRCSIPALPLALARSASACCALWQRTMFDTFTRAEACSPGRHRGGLGGHPLPAEQC
jgi:hypothetical protein